jgi:putative toxin-antitoxin system antitoxin component (TIGR02293 family)
MARLLGLPHPDRLTDLEVADQVAAGLSLAAVNAIRPILDLVAQDALYRVVSEATISRAKRGDLRLKAEASERLYRMGRVLDEAALLFRGEADAMAAFLGRPNPALDGRTPFAVACASAAGADLVVGLLREARAGVPL